MGEAADADDEEKEEEEGVGTIPTHRLSRRTTPRRIVVGGGVGVGGGSGEPTPEAAAAAALFSASLLPSPHPSAADQLVSTTADSRTSRNA